MRSLLRNATFALSLSLSAITVIAVPVVSAQAAVPTDASLMKLIEVTKLVEMMDGMTSDSAMTEQIMQGMLAALPSDDLSKSQRQRYDAIVSKYSAEITDSMKVQKFNKQIIAIYIESAKRHFNQQEVDAQIEFYSSDIGQNIIKKQPAMMEDYLAQVTKKIMPAMMEESIKNMQTITPRMTADIEALMAEK